MQEKFKSALTFNFQFPETIGAMGRAALRRRRVWWPRSSAAGYDGRAATRPYRLE